MHIPDLMSEFATARIELEKDPVDARLRNDARRLNEEMASIDFDALHARIMAAVEAISHYDEATDAHDA